MLIWPVDAMVDAIFFFDESFREELFHPSMVEIYFRSVVMIFMMAFAFYAHFSTRRLQLSKSLIAELRDKIPDLIFYKDIHGVYIGCNQAFCDFVGKDSEAEILGASDYDLFDKAVADFFREYDATMLKDNCSRRNDEWVTYPDGRRVLLDTLKTPLRDKRGKTIGILGISRDITERNQAEKALKESEQKFSGIVEQAGDAIISIDEMQRISLFNSAAEHIFGYRRDEVLGENVNILIPSRYHQSHKQRVEQFNAGEMSSMISRKSTMIGLRNNGEEFPIEISVSRLAGDSMVMTVMLRDISEQLKSGEVLRKLSRAIEQAGEAVLITNRIGIIEYVNPAFSRITGYAAEEVIGNTPAILNSRSQTSLFYREMWDTIIRGEVWQGTLVDKKKDGTFYPVMMSIAPIHDEDGEITHFVSLQQDMTEYKAMEKQFVQAQKMESIGTLVGGIAHDFNNMLAAILGNVYLSMRNLDQPRVVSERLESIEALSSRAADMVKQLLAFARKDRLQLSVISMNHCVDEGYTLVKATIPENIEIIFELCTESLAINGDATQLQQVMMNLLNNARDAVSSVQHPRIACKLDYYVADEAFLKAHSEAKGRYFARLTIEDNGNGIPKEHLNKIFEPFFTSKGVGEGTGLGLAMVYGTVQSHDGIIEVASEPDNGTCFSIYFPLSDQIQLPDQAAGEILSGCGETILLVDDEQSMRDTTAEVLGSMGYTVLCAINGEEALSVFEVHQQDIALILTDVVMPKVSGVDLAQAVRQTGSDVPIIFATGYDRHSTIASGDEIARSSVIGKPFLFQQLSSLMRKMIEQ